MLASGSNKTLNVAGLPPWGLASVRVCVCVCVCVLYVCVRVCEVLLCMLVCQDEAPAGSAG